MSASESLSRTEPGLRSVPETAEPFLTIGAGHAPGAEVHAHPLARQARSRLFVRRLEVDACIGAYAHEHGGTQKTVVDLEFGVPSELACQTDRLSDAIDYAEVVARLRALAVERHYELVESLAEAMARMLQREFGVPWLTLSLAKLAPFPGAEVGVVIERGKRA